MDIELTIAGTGKSLLDVKRSKFYGFAYQVSTRDEVDKMLSTLRNDFSDATHIVYAFRLGEGGAQEYFTDSGEPSGTAGQPIMRVIKGKNMTDVLIAVVRYFGGTKLGTGGLARAYSDSARIALENTPAIQRIQMIEIKIRIPYAVVSKWAIFIDSIGGMILEQQFEEDVTVMASIPEAELSSARHAIADMTRGAVKLEFL